MLLSFLLHWLTAGCSWQLEWRRLHISHQFKGYLLHKHPFTGDQDNIKYEIVKTENMFITNKFSLCLEIVSHQSLLHPYSSGTSTFYPNQLEEANSFSLATNNSPVFQWIDNELALRCGKRPFGILFSLSDGFLNLGLVFQWIDNELALIYGTKFLFSFSCILTLFSMNLW